jgi:hypothetical protein
MLADCGGTRPSSAGFIHANKPRAIDREFSNRTNYFWRLE